MTGVATSFDGGVCGGRFKGSIFWLRERRRTRSEDVGFVVGVVAAAVPVLASSGPVSGTGSTALSAGSVFGLLSSLELCSVVFLERKTSRSLLTDDLFDSDWGGVSPVWVGRRDGAAESRLLSLPLKVDERDCVVVRLSGGSDSI